jgi:YCII-related domain
VTDGPFVETKDLIAGWYIIDVESWDRAVQLAVELSAAPGAAARRSTNGWRIGRGDRPLSCMPSVEGSSQ